MQILFKNFPTDEFRSHQSIHGCQIQRKTRVCLKLFLNYLTISVSSNSKRKTGWDVSTEDAYKVACLTYCSPSHVTPEAFLSSVSRNCHNFLPLYLSPYAAVTERKAKLNDFTNSSRAVYTLNDFHLQLY